jgi:hypothetical protein
MCRIFGGLPLRALSSARWPFSGFAATALGLERGPVSAAVHRARIRHAEYEERRNYFSIAELTTV